MDQEPNNRAVEWEVAGGEFHPLERQVDSEVLTEIQKEIQGWGVGSDTRANIHAAAITTQAFRLCHPALIEGSDLDKDMKKKVDEAVIKCSPYTVDQLIILRRLAPEFREQRPPVISALLSIIEASKEHDRIEDSKEKDQPSDPRLQLAVDKPTWQLARGAIIYLYLEQVERLDEFLALA